MSNGTSAERRHWTARRGFVAAAGFGLVSLYLLWASYGAAPLGFGGHDEAEAGHAGEAGGHSGGHGAAPTAEAKAQIADFRGLVERFAEEHKLADGSVQPGRPKFFAPAPKTKPEAGGHASDGHGHGHAAPKGAKQAAAVEEAPSAHAEEAADGPIDVYLMASQFGFMPAVLRLEAGVP
jgi:hypothetical protein